MERGMFEGLMERLFLSKAMNRLDGLVAREECGHDQPPIQDGVSP